MERILLRAVGEIVDFYRGGVLRRLETSEPEKSRCIFEHMKKCQILVVLERSTS